MRSLSQNQSSREVQSLHFELVADKEEVYQVISKLRKEASLIFPAVSKIFRLFNEACIPYGSRDPLLEPKIMGRGLLVRNRKLLTITPQSIIGFGFLLPTDIVAYIGLATYPTTLVDVAFDGQAVWSGIVNTFVKRGNVYYSYRDCVDSHIGVCDLLQEADRLGVLQFVKDSTDFWTTRNMDSLIQLFQTKPSFYTLSV